PGPGSARSAGLALADRWLGDEPWDNPAWADARGIALTGALLHMNRQDLAADSRAFDQQAAFFGMGGGRIGGAFGRLGLAAYAYQPVMRFEDVAFEKGERGGPSPPAIIQSSLSSREIVAGLAGSWGSGPARFGLAGEWTHR